MESRSLPPQASAPAPVAAVAPAARPEMRVGPARAARFRYLPLSAGRELFLPLGPAAVAAGGLALYAPMNPAGRAYRLAMLVALRLGLAPALLRTRSLGGSPSIRHLDEHAILARLRERLGPVAAFAVYQGKEAVVRKPTVLALDDHGRPIAYAKIGWNPETRELVEREHEALRLLAALRLRHARFAEVIDYLDIEDSRILVTTPLSHINAAPEFQLTDLHLDLLVEVGRATAMRARLAESAFWTRANERLNGLQAWLPAAQARVLEAGLARLDRDLGRIELPWILRFGDFLPWNFGVDRAERRIDLVDLEFAEPGSPLAWDLFHFLIGIRRGFAPIDPADRVCSAPLEKYLLAFGVDPALLPWLQLAYLVDLTLFFRHMWRDRALTPGATVNTELRVQAISRLLAETAGAASGA